MAGSCPHCLKEIPGEWSFCGHCGAATSPDAPVPFPDASGGPPPRLPDRYRIRRLLGRGGMGRVYLCEDLELEVEVAVKVLPSELAAHEKAMETIEREARVAAKLRGGPGILVLYGFERFEGRALLVMEYAPGGSLHSRIREKRGLPEDECRRHGSAIADALAFAHERKILHRDIKPANVLLSAGGAARVADFGLAKVLADTSRITSRSIAGTPVYLPPEVIDGERWEPRSDLYSLGCLLWEAAAGVAPYDGTFAEVAALKTRRGVLPPDLQVAAPFVSAEFASLVRHLMARDPVERIPDAATAASMLRGETPTLRAPSPREPVLADGPVEPAVRGLPPPSHPPLDPASLPEGIAEHRGRLYSLADGAEMAHVPGGPFTMGSDHGPADEAPARTVHLAPFLIDRHEVTVAQFAAYCRRTGRAMPEQPEGSGDHHPVVNVTHEEARGYAEAHGRLLPTEAQWEKAARGVDARAFPWGNDPPSPDRAHYRDPAHGGTASVGDHRGGASPFGVLDMVGNAWEWCADWYDGAYYATAPDRDPVGPPEGSSRVLRGGAWNDPPEKLRVTRRRRSRPESRYDFVGFRCVREL